MKRQVLDNARLWIGDGQAFDGYLVLVGDTIEAVCRGRYAGPMPTTDLGGAPLSPGMIDLMVLGGFNRSIVRDDPMDIAREYLRMGVTACQLCTGTLPWESMQKVVDNAVRCHDTTATDAARMLGVYFEGPFQHPELTGASLKEYARPANAENIQRMIGFGSAVTMVNISPGIDGDAAAIAQLTRAGKTVSMAHSNAPSERVEACIDAGTTVLGHVWDNNSGLLGDSGVQQPTIEHVALTDTRVRFIHMICDGSHVHPVMMRLVLRCRGTEGICLVTDAVPRAGCPDGPYIWDDGRPFYKKGGVGRTDKHHLTGSALLLPDHFRNFVRHTRLAPEQAVRTVTLNPAASIGQSHRMGLLAPGRLADVVTWDEQLKIKRVWRGGREITNVSDYAEVSVKDGMAFANA
ncbi:MAG: amidohydrolase family protein [Planctomycetota bacterium]|nr:amidohydrolase family protein [Planctomycetota bacterium]